MLVLTLFSSHFVDIYHILAINYETIKNVKLFILIFSHFSRNFLLCFPCCCCIVVAVVTTLTALALDTIVNSHTYDISVNPFSSAIDDIYHIDAIDEVTMKNLNYLIFFIFTESFFYIFHAVVAVVTTLTALVVDTIANAHTYNVSINPLFLSDC